jgi:glycosyltransferase involved in cell wall biosynthesis
MHIVVCVITLNRPDGLRTALRGLDAQMLPGGGETGDITLSLVVIDNDPEGGARAVCDALRPALACRLTYGIEPRRGIPFARNRAVAVARAQGADWIGFIDDDEEPAAGWLAELVRVQASTGADVVTGPVVPRFVGSPPAWAEKGRFFQRLRHATGARRDRAFTNNVIFRAAVFDRVHPHFDERMALTGGSDSHFSRRVHRAGFRIVWADAAEVFETFPASRVSPAWVYQRAYRIGTTTAFIQRDLRGVSIASGFVLPIAGYRVLKGSVQALLGLAFSAHWRVAGVRQLAYAAGMVVGLFGGRYNEYARTHGS